MLAVTLARPGIEIWLREPATKTVGQIVADTARSGAD